jgi:C-terminal processing protease CtpA/Prc
LGKKEKTIEIIASPGKLGFVIDAPLDGPPVVHAVKETSVLGDKIKVGDKLLSIDGQKMAGLTSIEISNIMKEKASSPRRTIAFQRSSGSNDADEEWLAI